MYGNLPPYEAYVGFWLNRKRFLIRQAYSHYYGAVVALGKISPGSEFWGAAAESDEEAATIRAIHEQRGQ